MPTRSRVQRGCVGAIAAFTLACCGGESVVVTNVSAAAPASTEPATTIGTTAPPATTPATTAPAPVVPVSAPTCARVAAVDQSRFPSLEKGPIEGFTADINAVIRRLWPGGTCEPPFHMTGYSRSAGCLTFTMEVFVCPNGSVVVSAPTANVGVLAAAVLFVTVMITDNAAAATSLRTQSRHADPSAACAAAAPHTVAVYERPGAHSTEIGFVLCG
jgi:hypothetical protein